MRKTADKLFSPLVFQILILVATAFTLVPFIHYAYGGYVKYILLFGIVVCVYQLVRRNLKDSFKDKVCIAVLCFAFFYLITILLNQQTMFTENVKQLCYMVVFFLLLFSFKYKDCETMTVVSYTIVAMTLLLTANSFATYLLNISEWYVSDSEYYIGFNRIYRFWGFYNPNTGGAIAVISIIASLYVLFVKKAKNRIVCVLIDLMAIANIVLQYIVLLLSESRGAYYGFLIAVFAAAFIAILKNFKPEKTSAVLRALIAIAVSVLLIFVLLKVSACFQHYKDRLCIVSKEDAVDISKDTGYENYLEEIIKKYFSDTSALAGVFNTNTLSIRESIAKAVGRNSASDSTGRLAIWESAVMVFREKPILGWTHEGSIESINVAYEQINGGQTSSILGGGIHNVYLTILCSSGVVGFICFTSAILLVLIRFLKMLFKQKRISPEILFSFTLVLFFLVSELVESRILYTVSFFNVVFLALSWLSELLLFERKYKSCRRDLKYVLKFHICSSC